MEKKIFKVDLIIAVAVIVIGVLLVGVFLLMKKPGKTVIVSVDGKKTASYPLSEDRDEWITGKDGGKNRLIIKDGSARIEEADCPDKLCVKQGSISNTNESIVCLPHRITVRIAGEADADTPDAIAK